jgi:hypothetical protein
MRPGMALVCTVSFAWFGLVQDIGTERQRRSSLFFLFYQIHGGLLLIRTTFWRQWLNSRLAVYRSMTDHRHTYYIFSFESPPAAPLNCALLDESHRVGSGYFSTTSEIIFAWRAR